MGLLKVFRELAITLKTPEEKEERRGVQHESRLRRLDKWREELARKREESQRRKLELRQQHELQRQERERHLIQRRRQGLAISALAILVPAILYYAGYEEAAGAIVAILATALLIIWIGLSIREAVLSFLFSTIISVLLLIFFPVVGVTILIGAGAIVGLFFWFAGELIDAIFD